MFLHQPELRMNLESASAGSATVKFSTDELRLVNNALNEVCHGVHIGDAEFQTRLGAPRSDAQALLRDVAAAISAIERTAGDHHDRRT